MQKTLALAFVTFLAWTPFVQAKAQKVIKHSLSHFDNKEFDLSFEKNRERSLFLSPMISSFLPGFGQALEGQETWAWRYAGTGATGLLGARLLAPNRIQNPYEFDMLARVYMTAGSFSAYHDFRSAIRSYKTGFEFIKKEDSIEKILKAPFDFSHLKNPRVSIPLMVAGLSLFSTFGDKTKKPIYSHSSGRRAAFTFGTPYMAGTGEEVFYRGYALPAFQYGFNGNFWLANIAQSLAFGAAHMTPQRPRPIAETIYGLYFGWLARESNYSLKPGVFLHHWWDVLVLTRELLNPNGVQNAASVNLINLTF